MGLIIPDSSQTFSIIKKYLPGSVLVGGAGAGLQHLAGMIQNLKKDEEEKQRSDVLTVQIPSVQPGLKTAASPLSFAERAAAAGLASQGGIAAGAKAMNGAEKALAQAAAIKRNLAAGATVTPAPVIPAPAPAATAASPVAAAGGGGSGGAEGTSPLAAAPASSPVPGSAPVAQDKAGLLGWIRRNAGKSSVIAAAGIAGVGSAAKGGLGLSEESSSLGDAGLMAGVIPLGVIGGYQLINHFIKKREKKNLEDQLSQAKNEYSHLLGSTLAKSASGDDELRFPVIDGICFSMVEGDLGNEKTATSAGMLLLGVPPAVGVLSAIAAHRWMYDKQKELEALHTAEKPKPPKQIRFVSAPPEPVEDEENPLSIGLQPAKIAALTERLLEPGKTAQEFVDDFGQKGETSIPVSAADVLGDFQKIGPPMKEMGHTISHTASTLKPVVKGALSTLDAAGRGAKAVSDITDQVPAFLAGGVGGVVGMTGLLAAAKLLKHYSQSEKDQKEAAASIGDIFDFIGTQTGLQAAPATPEEALQKQIARKDDENKKQPKLINVAPGVSQVTTQDGPVELEAEDPEAARVLSKTAPQITKLLAAFQSTPAELR